jgi:two-component sensor histidine kinase
MLLVAAVPVLLLASVIAWQNYRVVAGRALERVQAMRAAAVARHDAVLDGASSMLDALATLPALRAAEPDACVGILRQALAFQGSRVGNLFVIDPDGKVRCSAAPLSEAARISADRATTSDGRAVAAVSQRTAAGAELILAMPMRGGDSGPRGTVVATVPLGWLGIRRALGDPTAPTLPLAGWAWLIGADGRAVPLADAPASALPKADGLTAMLMSSRPTMSPTMSGESQGGAVFAYALANLTGDLRLLVATSAEEDIAGARAVLARRLVGLGILLVAGLAAVALGANQSVVAPIKRLSQAVQRWRGGETFDPGPMHGVPLEVRDLSASFAQAANALAEREQQLRTAMAQQELLMQEIHHRVKNNLQIVASLLNLQASRIRLPEAKREFQSARDRIRALATLHRHLYAYGDLHTINMPSFLNELCGQLLQAMGERPEHGAPRIEVHIEASELQISSDQAVPMALIVTEAVSNAAKYAFPGGRPGQIQVRLTTHGNEALLVIEDNGVGLPVGPTETDGGLRDGIGLHLIRGFARQLGGELKLTHEGGTRYEVAIAIRRERQDTPETVLG